MGRQPRQYPAGTIVHAFNRGVERRTIFDEPGDYDAFMNLLREGRDKELVRIFSYCVMPNHWHFVLQAQVNNGISIFVQWLTHTHVKRYRKFHRSVGNGHLYQDRFKSPVIEGRHHLLTAMRYVESNAAVANLVRTSEEWIWSSGYERQTNERSILSDPPNSLPADWSTRLADYVAACRRVPGTGL